MARLVIGKKGKAKSAFKETVKSVAAAAEIAETGDHERALSDFNAAIEALRAEWCRQALSEKLILDSEWTELMAASLLGKARAVAALDQRNIVFEQIDKIMFDVFALSPEWPAAHEFMASLAISRGYNQKALPHIKRLLAVNPHHQGALFLLARIDFENGDYDGALAKIGGLAESADSLICTARIHMKKGRPEEAIEVLERERARFGGSYQFYYYIACALARAGRLEDACRHFKSAQALEPRRAEPLIQLGYAYLVQGLTGDAERCFKDAINFGGPLGQNTLGAYYGLALAADPPAAVGPRATPKAATGPDQYKAHVESLGRMGPDSDFLHLARGRQHERAGHQAEAAAEYGAVAPTSQLAGAARCRLGFMLYRAGQYGAARDMLRQAAQLGAGDRKVLDLVAAASALSGDFSLAVSIWREMAGPDAEPRINRALKQAKAGAITETINRGRVSEATDLLETYSRESGEDEKAGRALAELYFASAIEQLNSAPPGTAEAREILLLGKHLTGHLKFDYCLALVDLIEGHFQPAAGRLRSVLAANAKNPGASYHLGLALVRAGDPNGAETALRHGVAVSFNQPSRLGQLRRALAALLIDEERWSDAAAALEGFVPGDTDSSPTPAEVFELRIRCLAMAGEWEAAEKMILADPKRKRTRLAALVLARRNARNGRPSAAYLQVERYLKMIKDDDGAGDGYAARAKRAYAQLGLKSAGEMVLRLRFRDAEAILKRTLSNLTATPEVEELRAALAEFAETLEFDIEDPGKGNRLAEQYATLAVELELQVDDLRPPALGFQVVPPPIPKLASDLLPPPVLVAGEWDASPYPEPLVVFDC